MDISTYGLDAAQLQSTQFRALLIGDWITLLERSRLVRIHRDETLLLQGLASPGLYIVKRGSLRVEHGKPGGTLVLGRRGPGELLGEDPDFATRFYRSLAIHLSARLRESAMRVEQA